MDYKNKIKEYGSLFASEAEKAGLSQSELARIAKVGQGSVSRVFNGAQNSAFAKIMLALGFTVSRSEQPYIKESDKVDEARYEKWLSDKDKMIAILEEQIADLKRQIEALKKTRSENHQNPQGRTGS